MITSILIANRGEIACRIIRTCQRLGIRTVAVYSAADAQARHVALADAAVLIGAAPAAESYLNSAAILAAAKRVEADAIHPGYGFLSENAEFARACQDADFIFIGPAVAAIAAMGNKRAAKLLMQGAGVPTVPGYSGEQQDDATLLAEAERIGMPLMVKAAAGGGGKGMRLVLEPAALGAALDGARREALAAFGSAELILERALIEPRHIEVQIFGDHHGSLIHLGERECSIQRRHQKIIEEAPSPALSPAQRAAIGAAAVAAGRTIGYTNAGTVEFLLDRSGSFYFLEMNTRLQVEHPVTEAVTGLDLVEWQIRVSEGEPLPLSQSAVVFSGHAVEARVYAEDPASDFLPAIGPILLWREPTGAGVRVESGIRTGDTVSVYYDPMLAKIIAHGPDRPTALRRLARALETSVLLGCSNNLAFLRRLVLHPAHLSGDLSTAFLAQHAAALGLNAAAPTSLDSATTAALTAATLLQWQEQAGPDRHWRNSPNAPQRYHYRLGAATLEVQLTPPRRAGQPIVVQIDQAATMAITFSSATDHDLTLTVDGYRQTLAYARQGDAWWIAGRGAVVQLNSLALLPEPQPTADAAGGLRAPMPGSVSAVLVEVGQQVAAGTALLTLEAMKMEHTIRTAAAGVVTAIFYRPGDSVQADSVLVEMGDVAASC